MQWIILALQEDLSGRPGRQEHKQANTEGMFLCLFGALEATDFSFIPKGWWN